MTEVVIRPGAETRALLQVLEDDHGLTDPRARQQKVDEASRILDHGPVASGSPGIGLALGFVQSGKTMSFTTLAALAADNGYRIVIMVLGNTHLLVDQNRDRLLSDLRISDRPDQRWIPLHHPERQDVDFLLSQESRVVLITVLKSKVRLERLAAILEESALARSTPTLIIDDEADQASLNAGVRKGKRTPVFRSIQRVRRAVPRHLYVQYTATPFAPLLLEPTDDLAPGFVELLAPGAGYTGGSTFFVERRDAIPVPIDDTEAEEKAPDRLPIGLKRALLSFFAGAVLLKAEGRLPTTVSMLVHTSGMRVDHRAIATLLEGNLAPWAERSRLPAHDPAMASFIRSFDDARSDLVSHGMTDVSDSSMAEHLAWCLGRTKVWEVNSSGDVDTLDWRIAPLNILVGGNKLDRGFTVKGLTTTYMTRATEGGQADTVEQRARCYGYKAGYIDACRFFAPRSVIDSFTALVHTEADMRESLLAWTDAGRPVGEWSAVEGLLLPDDMRPTRPTVVTDTYSRSLVGWTFLRSPDLDPVAHEHNVSLLDGIGLLDQGCERIGGVSLRRLDAVPTAKVLEQVIEPWRVSASPGWDHEHVRRVLRQLCDGHLLPQVSLVHLGVWADGAERPRRRRWVDPGGFVQLHQGRDDGTGYPGDRRLIDTTHIQFHRVASPTGGEVYGVALHVAPGTIGPTKTVRRA